MSGPVNAVRRVVEDYGPDPADSRILAGLWSVWHRVQGAGQLARLGGDTDPGGQFYGYGPAVQDFRGAANGGAHNIVTYRPGGNADISSGIAEGTEGDPARRIFAARLRRGYSW